MDPKKIGAFLASLRKASGMTQQALGDVLGVTNKTISRWEHGVYLPDLSMLQLLSQQFHVSVDELLSGERRPDAHGTADSRGSTDPFSAFSLQERMAYWTNKWRRDHLALILGFIAFCVGLFIFSWLCRLSWLVGLCPLLWLATYIILRNKMQSYAERQCYPSQDA